MLRPSRDTSVSGLAAIMREGVVIVFCFVCSTVIGWYWHKLLSVSHTPLRSFRNNVQRVYTQQRWWISQLARFRPRNRVWTWTLKLERERRTERWPSIKPMEKWFPRLLSPLSVLDDFCLFFSARDVSSDRVHGTIFPLDWWCVVCHRLLFSWKTVTDADDFISSFRLTLPYLRYLSSRLMFPGVFCLSLSRCFLCQAFDVIGKASRAKKGSANSLVAGE